MTPDQLSFAGGPYLDHSKCSDIGVQSPLLPVDQQTSQLPRQGDFSGESLHLLTESQLPDPRIVLSK